MSIGIALLTLLLAVATFQSSAVAATARPTTAAYDEYAEAENFVNWVYLNLLFRQPDQAGFTYWTEHVEEYGPGPFVNAVVGSREWRETWVKRTYALWLDRQPDAEGLAYWTNYLTGHAFATFESLLGGSDEAYDQSGGTDASYIVHVYDEATSRGPTEGEVGDGLERLAAGSRSDFVSFVLLHGDGLTGRVSFAYNLTLGRGPDPEGESYWIVYYHNTGDFAAMLAHMLLSPEGWRAAQQGG